MTDDEIRARGVALIAECMLIASAKRTAEEYAGMLLEIDQRYRHAEILSALLLAAGVLASRTERGGRN